MKFSQKTKNFKEGKISRLQKKKIEKIFFWSLVCFVIFSFFVKSDFKSVRNPRPELFKAPIRSDVLDSETIRFSQQGFDYEMLPLYEYEMSALVVNRINYTLFSLTRTSNVFPVDLCVTWGENVKSGAYRHPSVSFRQNMRFCFGNWSNESGFEWNEVSNNHLVIQDKKLRKRALSIKEGDQIRLKGKLVNVKVESSDGVLEKYESGSAKWNSSIKLGDSGPGACEVIYVEELEVLRQSNPFFAHGFRVGLSILIIFVVWKVGLFFYELSRE